jgi:hypothetical protein
MSLKNLVGPIAIAPILALASSANASITYIGFESLGGATVNLSITTDGVVGTVSRATSPAGTSALPTLREWST